MNCIYKLDEISLDMLVTTYRLSIQFQCTSIVCECVCKEEENHAFNDTYSEFAVT